VGRWLSSGTLDPDLAAVNGYKWRGRRNAAAGGERRRARRRTRSRVPAHELKRGWHLREAREHAKLAEATAAAGSRRSGKVTPARHSGRLNAPARKQVTPQSSSPPGTSPGKLLGDEAASAARSGGGGNLGFRRLAARSGGGGNLGFRRLAARRRGGADCSYRTSRGAAATLNSPGRNPWREGHAEKACFARTRAAAVVSGSRPTRGRG
jgi:hypothetical protein